MVKVHTAHELPNTLKYSPYIISGTYTQDNIQTYISTIYMEYTETALVSNESRKHKYIAIYPYN